MANKLNTDDLRAFIAKGGQVTNLRQIVAYSMLKSGCTYQQIAEVLNMDSRQQAKDYLNRYIKKIDTQRVEERN
jgi:DNA-binding CsgD family transcriptional regulator